MFKICVHHEKICKQIWHGHYKFEQTAQITVRKGGKLDLNVWHDVQQDCCIHMHYSKWAVTRAWTNLEVDEIHEECITFNVSIVTGMTHTFHCDCISKPRWCMEQDLDWKAASWIGLAVV